MKMSSLEHKLRDVGEVRILIINPNSSEEMTNGVRGALQKLPLAESTKIFTYTAPSSSPASIDDDKDIQASAEAVKNDPKLPDLESFDAVLVACYSVHTLLSDLSKPDLCRGTSINGIFEASITTVLANLHGDDTWGIVTTGDFWNKHLSNGVKSFIGQQADTPNSKFTGVYTTGLTAGDFHHVDPEEIQRRLKKATLRMFSEAKGDVRCVVMGCAGMAGLEDMIRSTAIEHYGEKRAKGLWIVDGVKAGVLQLEQTVRSRRAFAIS